MALRSNSSLPEPPRFSRSIDTQGDARPVMTDKQIKAYLTARETLRRIRRTSSLFMPPQGEANDFVVWCRNDRPRRRLDS